MLKIFHRGILKPQCVCFVHPGLRTSTRARQFSTTFIRWQEAKKTNAPVNEYVTNFDRLEKMQEEARKHRNRTAAYYTASLGVVFLALAFVAVPFYRALCKRTGWGGVPITDSTKFTPDKVIPVDTNKRIRIQFTCQSSGILPWKFTPLQREVYVVPGETALAFYRAKNMSKEDIIGMATYSVTPEVVAGYFNKIQCFCFEEQRLAAGEEVDMPVFFFIDPDFAKDPSLRTIDDVVLNYSFFRAHYTDGELAAIPAANSSLTARVSVVNAEEPQAVATVGGAESQTATN